MKILGVTCLPSGPVVKNLPASAGGTKDVGSIPGLGRAPEAGNGNLIQYYCLENPMDIGSWQSIVHGVAKSRHNSANKH